MLNVIDALSRTLKTKEIINETEKAIKQANIEVLNQTNCENETILHVAVLHNKIDLVKILLGRRGIQTDVQSYFYGTPLTYAIFLGHFDIAKLLIDETLGYSDEKNPGALHWAVIQNNKELVELLIKKGAKASTPKYEGYKEPPEWALKLMPSMAPFLYGEKDFSPLLLAIDQGNNEIVNLLLTLGVEDLNKSFHKTNALSLAAEKGNLEVFKLLLDYNADLDHKIENDLTIRQFVLNDFYVSNEIKQICQQAQTFSKEKSISDNTASIFTKKFKSAFSKNQNLSNEEFYNKFKIKDLDQKRKEFFFSSLLRNLLDSDPKIVTKIFKEQEQKLATANIQITIKEKILKFE